MRKGYRVIFETIDLDNPSEPLEQTTLLEEMVSAPSNCLDFSLPHYKQIELLQSTLDNILREKAALINSNLSLCPNCPGKLIQRKCNTTGFIMQLIQHFSILHSMPHCESELVTAELDLNLLGSISYVVGLYIFD